jgi:hypothetical protein
VFELLAENKRHLLPSIKWTERIIVSLLTWKKRKRGNHQKPGLFAARGDDVQRSERFRLQGCSLGDDRWVRRFPKVKVTQGLGERNGLALVLSPGL